MSNVFGEHSVVGNSRLNQQLVDNYERFLECLVEVRDLDKFVLIGSNDVLTYQKVYTNKELDRLSELYDNSFHLYNRLMLELTQSMLEYTGKAEFDVTINVEKFKIYDYCSHN